MGESLAMGYAASDLLLYLLYLCGWSSWVPNQDVDLQDVDVDDLGVGNVTIKGIFSDFWEILVLVMSLSIVFPAIFETYYF